MEIEVQGKTLKQITKLDLSNKKLKQIPEEIFQCTNLTKLILCNNSIAEVPQEIKLLKKLKVLDLSNNRIKYLQADLFKLPKLETLNVSNNQIMTLPRQLIESNIKNLLLQNNQVTNLPEVILRNLEKLNVSQNHLSEFIINQTNSKLKYLWISNNPIKIFQINKVCAPELSRIYAFTQKVDLELAENYKRLASIKGNSFKELENSLDLKTKPSSIVIEQKSTIQKVQAAPEVKKEITQTQTNPKVFISYSWDSVEHNNWVLNLAEKLCNPGGIDVILDKWELNKLGSLLPNFMESSINEADRVILVLTPNYKLKTDKLEGGVGYEYSIISAKIFHNIKTTKFIPLLRLGTFENSAPTGLLARIGVDFKDDQKFDENLEILLRDIHGKPKYKKPAVSPIPKFD
jgi:hypothetical protein